MPVFFFASQIIGNIEFRIADGSFHLNFWPVGGLGKEENYAYEIYELEFIPEVLFDVPYRQSLTALFPAFLKMMGNYHKQDIQNYFKDVYGYEGDLEDSLKRLKDLFAELSFEGNVTKQDIAVIEIESVLSEEEIVSMIASRMKNEVK